MVSSTDVIHVFQGLLGRSPENAGVIAHFQNSSDIAELIERIMSSEEFQKRYVGKALLHSTSVFNIRDAVLAHAVPGLTPDPERVINAFGVRINPKFLPTLLEPLQGTVEPPPLPSNWHADAAEFAAAFRAVDLATDRFTVAELGCGWGCWLNITGVAARRRGLRVRLIGVEGDEGHIAFMRECCADNGFSPDQVVAHHGIAAAQPGVALFPHQDHSGADWGLKPIFGATDEDIADAMQSGKYDRLRMVTLKELIPQDGPLDLLHIDIQGGEADLIEQSLPLLASSVAYIVVGTHSRLLEGRIVEALRGAGWLLEVERPALNMVYGTPLAIRDVGIDGVQAWRNPWLRP